MREKCSEVANDDPVSEWGGGLGTYGGPEGTHKCIVGNKWSSDNSF